MVLADQVNPVNQLYLELSNRYKAGWTFHRFLQGLRKFFGTDDIEDLSEAFQDLYRSLRAVSVRLDDLDSEPVGAELAEIRTVLVELMDSLDRQDRGIAPSLVRLFFQRVRTHDERILIELVRFYLEIQRGRSWSDERTDKVDFLMSRLAETVTDPDRPGDRLRLARVLEGLCAYAAPASPLDAKRVANRIRLIEGVRAEIGRVATFEELTERDLVAHYRKVKHGLGAMTFEPSILTAIVETNLLLAERIAELTHKAERRIFADYELVSELEQEGRLARDLVDEVRDLHQLVGRFRKNVSAGSLRLDEMSRIHELVGRIMARVDAGLAAAGAPGARPAPLEPSGTEPDADLDALSEVARSKETLDGLDELERRALQSKAGPKAGAEAGAEIGRAPEVDRLVLAGLSLRREMAAGAESAGPERRRDLVRLAGRCLGRFDALLADGLATGELQDADELRSVQVARMRLAREHASCWLELYAAPNADGSPGRAGGADQADRADRADRDSGPVQGSE